MADDGRYLVRVHMQQVHVQTDVRWRYLIVDPLILGFMWLEPRGATFAFEPHQAHLFSARDAVEAAVKLEAELVRIWGTELLTAAAASVRVEVVRAE